VFALYRIRKVIGDLVSLSSAILQDFANVLRRIYLLSTWVNKEKKKEDEAIRAPPPLITDP
jgi:hypothetical protein